MPDRTRVNQNPKTLHIVLNAVTEDSRVLKCAWSLGNAGWDVLVTGASPFAHKDQFTIGHARIVRLPLKVVITREQFPNFLQRYLMRDDAIWLIVGILRRLRRYRRKFVAKIKTINKSRSKTKSKTKSESGVPNLKRAVKAITPVALEFKPDVIHAHDYTALPIAGAIVEMLRLHGHKSKLIYDAHEYVPGVAHLTPPLAAIYIKNERKYSKQSAAILSVSDPMNDLLVDHLQIKGRPIIVANDPLVEGQEVAQRNLREDIGIDPEVPLMVYAGAVAPQRGVQTALSALHQLPGVHLVLVANPKNATVQSLMDSAKEVKDRFHVVPYVPNSELVSYLSTADIGLIPIVHRLNHEISLITKFGEYMQARLPILVSDVKTMSEEVNRLKNGEVFIAEDVDDFVRAARLILSEPTKYRATYTPEILAERSWERQAQVLLDLYNEIAGAAPEAQAHRSFLISEPEEIIS
jgi:glycosyltransferase involved in cell wall biosynthesis